MKAREQGFLLLTSHLGNPERKIMTTAQLRRLASRVQSMEKPAQDGPVQEENLIAIGYSRQEAKRIVSLLSDEDILSWYLSQASRKGCVPITRVSSSYPDKLRDALGVDCPGCLWAKGNLNLLTKPAIALVGSRDLKAENLSFAVEAGRQAALQGYVLVSGNARGADRAAQNACLKNGGQVISVVADQLQEHPCQDNVLYLSEDGFDSPFSAQRALSRNRVIHCLGECVLVAQSTLEKGGTWDGVTKNLRHGWSSVFCFDDQTQATQELLQMGAQAVTREQLTRFDLLTQTFSNFF